MVSGTPRYRIGRELILKPVILWISASCWDKIPDEKKSHLELFTCSPESKEKSCKMDMMAIIEEEDPCENIRRLSAKAK